jgi:integrase
MSRIRSGTASQNATINRELAALKRMFNLAYRSSPRKVYQVPVFPRLKENPPRKGFVEGQQYKQLCDNSKELWLRGMLALGYNLGFRKAELLNMRLRQVDLLNRTLTLDPGTTKNDEGRTVKMTLETYQLLRECVRGKGPDDFVFTRADGLPVRDFRGAWAKLCKAAGLNGLLFHDLRRSAVRNMVRCGVPERIAMMISGHKTRSVFDRYNIVSEADLTEAARRIDQGHSTGFGHSFGHSEQIEELGKEEQRLV